MAEKGEDIWKIRFDGIPLEQVESELFAWAKKAVPESLSLSFWNTPFPTNLTMISRFTKLNELILKNNGLREISSTSSLKANLRRFSIMNNQLTRIPFESIPEDGRVSFANNYITNITNAYFNRRTFTLRLSLIHI